MQKIYHKRNELLEVEFYQDKDCQIPFDFTNAKDLYIELKDGDCMRIFTLHTLGSFNIFTPYIPLCVSNEFKHGLINTYIKTLDDITPNLSKYIPEDNAVLFLSSEDCETYYTDKLTNTIDYSRVFVYPKIEHRCNKLVCTSSDCTGIEDFTKLTIFLPHGTQAELQKANEVAKELKEKHGVEEVNLFILHCFIYLYGGNDYINAFVSKENDFPEIYSVGEVFNKIITTNSTGLLKLQNNKRLQVIDCFDIFNDAL